MRLIPACLALSVALCGASAPVCAGSSSIFWPGWAITSSEDLSEINDGEKPIPHPLSALFDANSRTTWVMNPKATPRMLPDFKKARFFPASERKIEVSGKARWMSGLQIMNGDNSSRRAFLAGNRIRSLKITSLDGKKSRTYMRPLLDRMGWQRISWPRQSANKITIDFAEVLNSKKPVCSSGIGLLDGSREIKWNMPQAMLFYDGLEGEGAIMLLNRRGEVIDGLANDNGESGEWSSDGRFVAGINGGGGVNPYLWIADANKGKIIRKIYPRTSQEDLSFGWISAQQMKVEFLRPTKKSDGAFKPFQTKIYRF